MWPRTFVWVFVRPFIVAPGAFASWVATATAAATRIFPAWAPTTRAIITRVLVPWVVACRAFTPWAITGWSKCYITLVFYLITVES